LKIFYKKSQKNQKKCKKIDFFRPLPPGVCTARPFLAKGSAAYRKTLFFCEKNVKKHDFLAFLPIPTREADFLRFLIKKHKFNKILLKKLTLIKKIFTEIYKKFKNFTKNSDLDTFDDFNDFGIFNRFILFDTILTLYLFNILTTIK
jgi:hypothetical protein